MSKLSILLFITLFSTVGAHPLKAQEKSHNAKRREQERQAYFEELREFNKQNVPGKNQKLPLVVRKTIAKQRGITLAELDQAIVTENTELTATSTYSMASIAFSIILGFYCFVRYRKKSKRKDTIATT